MCCTAGNNRVGDTMTSTALEFKGDLHLNPPKFVNMERLLSQLCLLCPPHGLLAFCHVRQVHISFSSSAPPTPPHPLPLFSEQGRVKKKCLLWLSVHEPDCTTLLEPWSFLCFLSGARKWDLFLALCVTAVGWNLAPYKV